MRYGVVVGGAKRRFSRFAIDEYGVQGKRQKSVREEEAEYVAEISLREAQENCSKQNPTKELEARDASVFDLDLLDCTICAEPLASPIYQCENGHVGCASCSKKTSNVCPSCQQPTGSIRCLVLEKLIESRKVKCKFAEFGCTAMLKSAEKGVHQRICMFEPLNCPFPGCNFRHGRYSLFSTHVMQDHYRDCQLYDGKSINFAMHPTERLFIGFGKDLCFVFHRQPGGTVEMGQVGRFVGDMCYLTILKVLSESFAVQSLPYMMKLKSVSNVPGGASSTVSNVAGRSSSTFTIEAGCCIDERQGSLNDGVVVVAESNFVEILDLVFFPPRPSTASVVA